MPVVSKGAQVMKTIAQQARQSTRCPADLPLSMVDEESGLTSDEYFNSSWTDKAQAKMYMAQILVRIEQPKSANRPLRTGGTKAVTNIIVSNDKTARFQITAWEPHNQHIERLQIGQVGFFLLIKY